MLGVRLDKMLKLTLLRGGPAKPTNIAATEHNQASSLSPHHIPNHPREPDTEHEPNAAKPADHHRSIFPSREGGYPSKWTTDEWVLTARTTDVRTY